MAVYRVYEGVPVLGEHEELRVYGLRDDAIAHAQEHAKKGGVPTFVERAEIDTEFDHEGNAIPREEY